ncbi:MAG: alkaline phosphatase family protein [Betaproteobacteria bacterium]
MSTESWFGRRAPGTTGLARTVVVAALLVLGVRAPDAVAAPGPDATAPKLVVLIVVDQMRADYVEQFQRDWSGGLGRLVHHGAWLRRARYPYLTTVTCAGHATVSSGAYPHVSGVVGNAWWDREAGRTMSCTADPNARDIGYGFDAKGGDSAHRLLVPGLADVLRDERAAHVVALSLKDRSAIMLAGHGGDAVTWLSNSLDGWVTSSAFAPGPVPAVQQFVAANPIDADFGARWTRLLPPSRYRGRDDGVGEAPPRGWTALFPHVLDGDGGGKPTRTFYAQWERSPFADAYLGRMAAALAESMALGRHDGTDVLAISFSSTDLVGHAFGPRSQEVQDMYMHLDRTIGALLDRLDALVGRDEYVVALTADHGVTPIPEQLVAQKKDAGRIDTMALVGAAERAAEAALGPGKYVARVSGSGVYFEPGVEETLKSRPAALERIVAAIAARPGVAKVFRSEDLIGADTAADPLARAAALSYFPGRSGDLVLAPKPGWMFSATGTTHGSSSADDQRVPILFMGYGIRPGRYDAPASPADVAPTLAAICGVAMPKAEGHPLRDVLASGQRSSSMRGRR